MELSRYSQWEVPAGSVDVPRSSCRARPSHGCHRPPHPRGAGRASGTRAKPCRAGVGCWQENPDLGEMAGEEHGTACSPCGVLASEQRLGAGPAWLAHWAPAHGSAQLGGWDSISEESTESSSKNQALPELDSLTAGSSKIGLSARSSSKS